MDKLATCLNPMWQWLKNLFKKPTEVAESLKPKPPTPVMPKVPPVVEPSKKEIIVAELLHEMNKHLGLKETKGKNRSPEIDAIIKSQGGSLGSPYCMYGQQYVLENVCNKLNLKKPLPKNGSTQSVWKSIPDKYKSQTPKPGHWVFWQSKRKKTAGHVGMCASALMLQSVFSSLEFNTDGKGSRDGDGVFERTRSTSGAVSLRLLGFVDVAEMILDANKDKPTT